jgi:hypothetical protein
MILPFLFFKKEMAQNGWLYCKILVRFCNEAFEFWGPGKM